MCLPAQPLGSVGATGGYCPNRPKVVASIGKSGSFSDLAEEMQGSSAVSMNSHGAVEVLVEQQ